MRSLLDAMFVADPVRIYLVSNTMRIYNDYVCMCNNGTRVVPRLASGYT